MDPAIGDPARARRRPRRVPDIGNSALLNSACTTRAAAGDAAPHDRPEQAYVIAVPKASTQTAITFEEAYFVFGFGDLPA